MSRLQFTGKTLVLTYRRRVLQEGIRNVERSGIVLWVRPQPSVLVSETMTFKRNTLALKW